MENIFEFSNYNTFYQRCILASIAHAIMIGKFNLLTNEQSWDEKNYSFQNMEGIRGVISFGANNFVCVIQNDENYIEGEEEIITQLFQGTDDKVRNLVKNEALQYLMIENNDDVVPAASVAFWGDKKNNCSNLREKELLDICGNILLPYLCSEGDAKKYWKDYYEMNPEQLDFMEEIYELRINSTTKILLDKNKKEKLRAWLDEIDECIDFFSEINIYFD